MKTIWNYSEYFPFVQPDCRLSIGEGQTPLVRSRYIGPSLGLQNLYFKLENLNPTGSYKDRFAALFVSTLLEKQTSFCIATSSGNTGAALAAYCAAAGIDCHLVVVDSAPLPKLHQMQLYGGKVVMIEQFGLDTSVTKEVFDLLKQWADSTKMSLPVSAYCYCPEGMQAVQTIAWEILDELEGTVHHIFSPSGGGGLTLAVAKGVLTYAGGAVGCRVHCVQPEGNNTIAGALRRGLTEAIEIKASTTAVSGLQVPGLLDGTETLRHCQQTNGTGFVVADRQVFEMQQLLAWREGIFCEPAGAVSVSAVKQAVYQGVVDPTDTIVCLITGSGFKDMNNAVRQFQLPSTESKINVSKLAQFLATL